MPSRSVSAPRSTRPTVSSCWTVVFPASAIALEELGRPAANTAMLGAFARLTGWVSRAAVLDVLPDYFDGEALAGNRRAVERGHDEMVPAPAGEVADAMP